MYRSILVPLDGSSFSEHALPIAVSLARHADASLQLIHVCESSPPHGGVPVADRRFDAEVCRAVSMHLESIATRLRVDAGVEVTVACPEGEVVRVLRARASERGTDLIVMTTHGRGGVNRTWFGSVADRLIRSCAGSFLLVRPDAVAGVADHEPLFRRVLIPLDGSRIAEDVIDQAALLGTLGETVYDLLTVVVPRPIDDPFAEPTLPSDGAGRERVRREAIVHAEGRANGYLARLAADLRRDGATTESHVVIARHVAHAILEYSEQHSIDLIAMSTHGRSGPLRALMGSVADKVTRGAAVPVLLHRPVRALPSSARGHAASASASQASADARAPST